MKKILSLLTISVLASSPILSNILSNNISNKNMFANQDIKLPVSAIVQETDWYCGVANIQMILHYYSIESNQNQIYNALGGVDDEGISIDQTVADFLNYNIREHHDSNYGLVVLPGNFGHTVEQQILFQSYVYNSLLNNYPVLFGYDDNSPESHSVLISGINVNEGNPSLTEYIFINPANGETRQFLGSEINNFVVRDGELIGNGTENDFYDKYVNIKQTEKSESLNTHDYVKECDIQEDLTAMFGIFTPEQFKNIFGDIQLLHFKGTVFLFSTNEQTDWFHLSTSEIPNNNDNWKGPMIIILNRWEQIGGAYIQSLIAGELTIERSSLNHLIVHVLIFLSGWSHYTPTYALAKFDTGTVLAFRK